jgi:hypothetical protein
MLSEDNLPKPESESAVVSRREVFGAAITSAQREQICAIRRAAGARSAHWELENGKWILVTTWEAFL